ncbi:MAG TPA: hypothetical protein ENH06_01045 [bacterium]|nr:hypothetical protein [bacterium]
MTEKLTEEETCLLLDSIKHTVDYHEVWVKSRKKTGLTLSLQKEWIESIKSLIDKLEKAFELNEKIKGNRFNYLKDQLDSLLEE